MSYYLGQAALFALLYLGIKGMVDDQPWAFLLIALYSGITHTQLFPRRHDGLQVFLPPRDKKD